MKEYKPTQEEQPLVRGYEPMSAQEKIQIYDASKALSESVRLAASCAQDLSTRVRNLSVVRNPESPLQSDAVARAEQEIFDVADVFAALKVLLQTADAELTDAARYLEIKKR